MIRALIPVLALTLAAPAIAQDAIILSQQGDGTHRPQLREVQGANNVTTYYVIGDGAFGDVFGALAELIQRPDTANREVADFLWENRDVNPPAFLMEAARRYASIDPDRSAQAYFLGRARIVYDAMRCSDSTALQAIPIINEFAGPEMATVLSDPARIHAQLSAVYSSGEAFTSPASPWWICSSADSVFFAAVNNQPITRNEWLKQQTEWSVVRDGVNRNMLTNIRLAETAMNGQ
ncbi:hypothetical protein [Hyphobacterium marinum]|uniref:Uncharacterized protein n=1 Tax=Hyphobacterium marinum TaxID=3116574 RepID=A0ABU7M1F3_9PROT|nr:hypothetical protein [Hyphobacterium sp. Y6023]MEE2567648.1 hypothetical protein [Hyphobacterium sp. Y6023]